MRTRLLVPLALAAGQSLGCGHFVDAPEPPEAVPFIRGVLVAGRPPEVRVEVIGPGQSSPAALDPAAVDLALFDEAGARTPLVPAGPGRSVFRAGLTVAAGRRYRLEGTVAGRPVAAATRIPTTFEIVTPAGDTIALSPLEPGGESPIAAVPFTWFAAGATAFLIDSATFALGSAVSRATAGHFSLPRRAPGSPPGPVITILALNGDADGFLNGRIRPLTNITGGFGVLGGAIEIRRVVSWH